MKKWNRKEWWLLPLSFFVVFAFVACGGGGGGGSKPSDEVPVVLGQPGPGDADNHFPFTIGNIWNFQGTDAGTGLPPEGFFNAVTITGAIQVAGVPATVFLESNPGNLGESKEIFLVKDASGIAVFGNFDPTDTLTQQIVPFWRLRFPLQAGESFVSLDRKGIDLGEDLDGDGISEKADLRSVVSVIGFESVSVPVGTFDDCARVEQNLTLNLILSSDGSRLTVTDLATAWFAPNDGWVKRMAISSFPAFDFIETVIEELYGARVDGQGRGVLPPFIIAENVASADSDTSRPGRSALGFDGTNYLIVSCHDIENPAGLFGITLSESGQILNEFQITVNGCSANRALAFDGTNYLVTFDQEGQIVGTRVSPGGVVLDGPSGFQISSSAPDGATNFLPAVAFDGVNYLVVWQKFCDGGYDIFGSFVTPGGVVQGEFEIFSAPGEQSFPAAAFDGTNYLLAWRDTRTGFGPDIVGTMVTPAGMVLNSTGIPIATASGFQGNQPQIAFDGTNYLVVWEDIKTLGFSPPVDGRILGRRIAPDGTLLDGPAESDGIVITSEPFSHSPTATFDGTNFLVAWAVGAFADYPPAGIFARQVTTNGTLLNGPPDELGLHISGLPPSWSRFVGPVILGGVINSLLAWVNNSEIMDTTKSVRGAFIFPF